MQMEERTAALLRQLPPEIDGILCTLEAAGYEAWLAGGCVRDGLLGRPVHDWDITTAALPQTVTALFPRTVPTGLAHGTVTVLAGDRQAEVTTFRTDGAYRDGRHPEQVQFVPCLAEDLARRDFTVNAMALNRAGDLVDLYGGQADLQAGLLRCVGDPDRRFGEDALRMLRVFRFSAQLGFAVEAETAAAARRCAPRADALSAERVRDEMEKTLLSPRPQMIGEMAAAGLLRRFLPAADRAALQRVFSRELPAEPGVRWAALLLAAPQLDLEALRLPKKTARTARAAVDILEESGGDLTPVQLRRAAAAQGMDCARTAAALCGRTPDLEQELAAGHCMGLRDLAVNGTDFPDVHGPALGRLLQHLLDHVLEHPEDNRREVLLGLRIQD